MVKYTDYNVALENLKSWLLTQPHLPIIKEYVLEQFIHSTEGDLEIAKNVIDLQYCMRNSWPEFYIQRDPNSKATQIMYNALDIILLPGLTSEGWKITLLRLNDYDPDKFNPQDAIKLFVMLFDARMNTPDSDGIPKGEFVLFDAKGLTLKHITKLTLNHIRVFIKFNQDAANVKIRDIHVLNTPTFLDKILALIKPFLSKELFDMIKFHQPDSDTFNNYMKEKNLLPKEYGGNADVPEIKKEIHKILLDNRDYLMDKKYWVTDEGKRPANQPKPLELEGNFKTLNVD